MFTYLIKNLRAHFPGSSSPRKAPANSGSGRKPARKARLALEMMEDRLAPANLTVTNLAAPSVLAAGQNISGQYAVLNNGAATSSAWTDRVFLSTDAFLDAGDIALVNMPHSGGLGSNSGYSQAFSAIVPSTATGMKNILVVTDATGSVSETSEADNLRATPVAVVGAPSAGPIHDTDVKLENVFGGSLVPTQVTTNGATTSVTFQSVSGAQYQAGGFTVSNITVTTTLSGTSLSGTSLTVAGTAQLQVPLGDSQAVVPVAFSLIGNQLTITGATTIANFRFGAEPAQLAAQNVDLGVNLTVNTDTLAVSGTVSFKAANAMLLPESAAGQPLRGQVTLTNVSGAITSAGRLSATAAVVQAVAGNALAVRATDVKVVIDPAQPDAPLAVLPTAVATSPAFPGPSAILSNITISRTGFTIAAVDLTAANLTIGSNQVQNLRLSVRNLVYNRATGFRFTTLAASASQVVLLGGQATAAGVTFSFNLQTGTMLGAVNSLTGAIAPVSISASGGTLAIGPDATGPLFSVASATATMPVNGGTASLTVTGFRLEQDGRFSFDALAGLTLPGAAQAGLVTTASFTGDVRIANGVTHIRLTGPATVFGRTVQVTGDFSVTNTGLFGVLQLQSTTGGAMPVLGQTLGFFAEGDAFIMVNATTASRQLTAAGETRTVSAQSGRMILSGSVTVNGFHMEGLFDLVPSGNNVLVTGTATMTLGQFGTYQIAPTGTFTIRPDGVSGSVLLTKVGASNSAFDLTGTFRLQMNTTEGAVNGIPAGVVRLNVVGGIGMPTLGLTLNSTMNIGFQDNTGTANDFFFIQVSNSNALTTAVGGLAVNLTGELRSTGFVNLTGSTGVSFDLFGVPIAGASVGISITRTNTGAITFAGIGAVVVNTPIGPATASLTLSAGGLLTVSVIGLTFTFQM